MGLIKFLGAIVLVAVFISTIMVFFFSEEAPLWVEQDEYYRNRWYK